MGWVNTSPKNSGPLNVTPDDSSYSDLLVESCPSCQATINVTGIPPCTDVCCPECGQSFKARSLFNHFRVLALLGQGGMGTVYSAVDINLDRPVALKALKISLHDNPVECENLSREARTTALINHPHVVKVFDFGQAQGQFYLAMELIRGGSLDDLIQERKTVSEVMVLKLGIQIAQGLDAALEKGLIHRDIKPANILCSDPQTFKLVDFGLATAMNDSPVSSDEIWGTPYYIAPEKLDEKPEDYRSDIYSLGGTLFHALAGRPPYDAKSPSLVALKQLKSRPVSIQSFAPNVSNETAYVINRMMAKLPQKRYESYSELIDHLNFALEKAIQNESAPKGKKEIPLLVEKTKLDWIGVLFPALVILGILAFAYIYFFTRLLEVKN